MLRHFASPPTLVMSEQSPREHVSPPPVSTHTAARARKSVSRGLKTFMHHLSWHETEVAVSALATVDDLPLSLRLRTGRNKAPQRLLEKQLLLHHRKHTKRTSAFLHDHEVYESGTETPGDSGAEESKEVDDGPAVKRMRSSDSSSSEELGSKVPPIRIRFRLDQQASSMGVANEQALDDASACGDEGVNSSALSTSISIWHALQVTKQRPLQQVEQTAGTDARGAGADAVGALECVEQPSPGQPLLIRDDGAERSSLATNEPLLAHLEHGDQSKKLSGNCSDAADDPHYWHDSVEQPQRPDSSSSLKQMAVPGLFEGALSISPLQVPAVDTQPLLIAEPPNKCVPPPPAVSSPVLLNSQQISRTPSPKKGGVLNRKIEELMAQAQTRPSSLPGGQTQPEADHLRAAVIMRCSSVTLRPRAGSDTDAVCGQRSSVLVRGERFPHLECQMRHRLPSSSTLSGMPDTSPVSSPGADDAEKRDSSSAQTDEMKLEEDRVDWSSAVAPPQPALNSYLNSSLSLSATHVFEQTPPMLMRVSTAQPQMAEPVAARVLSSKVGHVEVSVVGSPELFGSHQSLSQSSSSKPPLITIDSDDERVIERCELNASAGSSSSVPVCSPPHVAPVSSTPAIQSPVLYPKRIAPSNSLCLPTTMPALNAQMQMDPNPNGMPAPPTIKSPNSDDGELNSDGSLKRRGSISSGTPLPPPKKRFFSSQEYMEQGKMVVDETEEKFRTAANAKSVAVLEKVVGTNEAARLIRPSSHDTCLEQTMAFRPRAVSAIVSRNSVDHPSSLGLLSVAAAAASISPNGAMRMANTEGLTRVQPSVQQMHTRPSIMQCAQSGAWVPKVPHEQLRPVPLQANRPPVHALTRTPAPNHFNGPVADVLKVAQPNATRDTDMNTLRSMQELNTLPHDEDFHHALNKWEWVILDGLRMPAVFRAGEKYVAVHMVQMRLLSKFPPNIPGDLMRKFTMVSHKMTLLECWIFNTVNALMCKFEFGCQLFSPQDEVVKLIDVERFYWSVKSLNLSRMIEGYRNEIRSTSQLHPSLTATISQLKSQVELDYMEVQKILSIAVNGPGRMIAKSPPLSIQRPQAQPQRLGLPQPQHSAAILNSGTATYAQPKPSASQAYMQAMYEPRQHVRSLYPTVSQGVQVAHGGLVPHQQQASYLSQGLNPVAHRAYSQAFMPSGPVEMRQYGYHMNGASNRSLPTTSPTVPHHVYR